MLRLLLALALVALLVFWLNATPGGAPDDTTMRPETQYRQATQKATTLEQQLQEQARKQLDAVDAVDATNH